ncbi:MAG: hypothetical protein ABFS46_11305 [Myxococcota bacterium]
MGSSSPLLASRPGCRSEKCGIALPCEREARLQISAAAAGEVAGAPELKGLYSRPATDTEAPDEDARETFLVGEPKAKLDTLDKIDRDRLVPVVSTFIQLIERLQYIPRERMRPRA